MPFLAPAAPFIGAGISALGGLFNRRAGDQTTTQGTREGSRSGRLEDVFQFDPTALEQYRRLQPQGAGVLEDYMRDPWSAGFFQQQLGRINEQAGQRGSTQMQGILNLANQPGLGVSNLPAFLASEAGRSIRGTSRLQSEGLRDLLMQAEQLRRGAAGAALGYNPLQTGATRTSEETSREAFDQSGRARSGSLLGDIFGTIGSGIGNLGGSRGGGPFFPAPSTGRTQGPLRPNPFSY